MYLGSEVENNPMYMDSQVCETLGFSGVQEPVRDHDRLCFKLYSYGNTSHELNSADFF